MPLTLALNELAERREPSGLTLKDRRARALPLYGQGFDQGRARRLAPNG